MDFKRQHSSRLHSPTGRCSSLPALHDCVAAGVIIVGMADNDLQCAPLPSLGTCSYVQIRTGIISTLKGTILAEKQFYTAVSVPDISMNICKALLSHFLDHLAECVMH